MNLETLFTTETTIKVSVVKIDNKKLTKGVYNQLNIKTAFDDFYNLKENAKLLGYVNDKSRFYLWTNGNSIFRNEIKELYPLIKLNLNKNTIDELRNIFPSEEVESLYSYKNENGDYEYRNLQISQVLQKNSQYELIEKKENVEKIVKEILNRQIFI